MPGDRTGKAARRSDGSSLSVVLVYLDHAATSPLRPEAATAMASVATESLGNPSGTHRAARAARRLLDDARDELAAFLGAEPGEVVLTSGGTEADNLAVRGVLARGGSGRCSAIEHHAVLEPVLALGGIAVAVHRDGVIDLDALAASLDDDVALVSVMLVNNETGIVQPLDDVAEVVRTHAPRALLHTDAVQAASWADLPSSTAVADLVSVSAHKFGGPVGVGALVVRGDVPLVAQLLGGGQERERRSGTPNVVGAVGAAAAARATIADRAEEGSRLRALRDRLASELGALPGVHEAGGATAPRAPTIVDVHIDGIESEALLFLLDRAGVCASAASSCASGALDPSHVLAAMGVPRRAARGSLRLSLGWSSSEADVDAALDAVSAALHQLRTRRAS